MRATFIASRDDGELHPVAALVLVQRAQQFTQRVDAADQRFAVEAVPGEQLVGPPHGARREVKRTHDASLIVVKSLRADTHMCARWAPAEQNDVAAASRQ